VAILARVPSSRAATAAGGAPRRHTIGGTAPRADPLDAATEREVVALLARLLVDWLDQQQRNAEPTPSRSR
jgi:hypothetical protein